MAIGGESGNWRGKGRESQSPSRNGSSFSPHCNIAVSDSILARVPKSSPLPVPRHGLLEVCFAKVVINFLVLIQRRNRDIALANLWTITDGGSAAQAGPNTADEKSGEK